MTQINRLPNFRKINQALPLNFTFNGRHYQGYEGDTLASALLANGVKLVGRSFKYHRPRGIMSCGSEETNAIVQLEPNSSHTLANIQATKVELYEGLNAESVNCWPNPDFDLMAILEFFHRILPAGFYYKTFMWPAKAWKFYEYFIRRAAGLGKSPSEPDPDHYDKINAHCDVLIVGGGPAGLSAAITVGQTGARTILVDEQPNLGGQLLNESQDLSNDIIFEWLHKTKQDLATMREVTILKRTTAFGYYDQNFIGLLETRTNKLSNGGNKTRQRLWRIHAKQVIFATGAIERPLIFSDNDRPGIMLAGAYRAYANRYGVIPNKNVVVFTNNDDAYRTAIDLINFGVNIPAIIDVRLDPDGELPTRATALGIAILDNMVITRVIGSKTIRAVELMALNPEKNGVIGEPQILECDGIAFSGGWNPVIHLYCQSGGKARYDEVKGIYVPEENTKLVSFAGAVRGSLHLSECLKAGTIAGKTAIQRCGNKTRKRSKLPQTTDIYEAPILLLWTTPVMGINHQTGKQFVDFQNDVTVTDIQLAAREGYKSIEHTKRYTTLGMATDQGKTGNIPGMAILGQASNAKNPGEVGTTTFRPPYTPVTIGAFAGGDIGTLFAPIRKTAIHYWHEQSGCMWEDVGDWKRPWYYPKTGETKHETLNRECLSARNAIGILDSSTLGKIDIQGPDAAVFLDRIYTNSWSSLKVGKCRYGLMLGEDGMIIDDGVTARLSKNHYLMTTTTGNAASVLRWLEEWLQTEWPDLKVFCTSVTEHWTSISLCGPKARALLSEFPSSFDITRDSFPFMTVREGYIANIPARIFRISFTGEPSFEINIPANYGLSLWTQLFNAGEKYGITPFGTESMHILRAEKGYIIVGQETDGSVTPIDLGMDWILSKKKDFIGKRSLSRTDTIRSDRKQLVGLLPRNIDNILMEGGQIVEEPQLKIPMPMTGHVTSSYYSANLKRSFALALIKNGRQRYGETVYIHSQGDLLSAEITHPKFFDPDGNRLND